MKIKLFVLVLCVVFLSGCASFVRRSPNFPTRIQSTKTIAVMPADITIYQINVGGVREIIDEWSLKAKELINQSLEANLTNQFQFKIKFISEAKLKNDYTEIWDAQRSLYEAVSISAYLHTFAPMEIFPEKLKVFDYTMGPEIKELAELCQADALLFVFGFDNEATAGRQVSVFFNLLLQAAVGGTAYYVPDPNLLVLGLVDGKTGDLLWFKALPSEANYDFRNPKHVDLMIKWFLKDFYGKNE